EETDFDAEPRANLDADPNVVEERVPRDQKVRVGFEPDLNPIRAVGRLHPCPRHHAGIGQGEVGLALEIYYAEEDPVVAYARHVRKFGRFLEGWVITADRDEELRLLEPHEVREPAR